MSQSQQILEHLESGETLTPAEALQSFGCFRLAARIADLRRDGHDIETILIRNGRAAYASYRLVNA